MPTDEEEEPADAMLERSPMILVKCHRCELNYMNEHDELCKICYREVHGVDSPEEPELCSECNVERALPGRDLCIFCLKDRKKSRSHTKPSEEEPVDIEMNDVSGMEEIIPDIEEDDPEYHEIGDALSLEEMVEQEDRDDDEDEDMDE